MRRWLCEAPDLQRQAEAPPSGLPNPACCHGGLTICGVSRAPWGVERPLWPHVLNAGAPKSEGPQTSPVVAPCPWDRIAPGETPGLQERGDVSGVLDGTPRGNGVDGQAGGLSHLVLREGPGHRAASSGTHSRQDPSRGWESGGGNLAGEGAWGAPALFVDLGAGYTGLFAWGVCQAPSNPPMPRGRHPEDLTQF